MTSSPRRRRLSIRTEEADHDGRELSERTKRLVGATERWLHVQGPADAVWPEGCADAPVRLCRRRKLQPQW